MQHPNERHTADCRALSTQYSAPTSPELLRSGTEINKVNCKFSANINKIGCESSLQPLIRAVDIHYISSHVYFIWTRTAGSHLKLDTDPFSAYAFGYCLPFVICSRHINQKIVTTHGSGRRHMWVRVRARACVRVRAGPGKWWCSSCQQRQCHCSVLHLRWWR